MRVDSDYDPSSRPSVSLTVSTRLPLLADAWIKLVKQLTNPINSLMRMHVFTQQGKAGRSELADSFTQGLTNTLIGVEFFNVVVTTPRLLYASFG